MACPYFSPQAPRAQRSGLQFDSQSSMLPLGDVWTGTCHAVPEQLFQPADAILRPLCNLGYARETCARFPAGDGPDAVRFTISRCDGATLRLYYVMERDHHPFAHGPLEYSRAARSFVTPVTSETPAAPHELVLRQAQAYVESYLRRKSEA